VQACKGPVKGVKYPPYDPRPFAELLGATEIRGADLDVAGRIVVNEADVVIEFNRESTASYRRRFTLAHEVGHLALWEAEKKLVPDSKPRRARSQAVERLCDAVAAELLAPHAEIRSNWRAVCKRPLSGRIGPDPLKMIEDIAKEFGVSLQMAAIRFVEVCSPQMGVGLLDIRKECFVWCHRVPDRASLLALLLRRHKEGVAGNLKDTGGLFSGADSYALTNTEVDSVPAEWRSMGFDPALCLVVVKPRTFSSARRRRRRALAF